MYNMYQLKQSKNEETDKLRVFSFFPYSGKFYSQGQLNSEPPKWLFSYGRTWQLAFKVESILQFYHFELDY